jgi:type IV pilus assembly protein PilW
MTRQPRHPRRVARGFGLVETMVAMTIGLFLALAVAVSFGSTRSTFLSQGQLGELQDQTRLAMSMLTNSIENAGYYPDPVANDAFMALPADNTIVALAAGQSVWSALTPSGSDRLVTRYRSAGGDGLMDCLGGVYAVPTLIVNDYTVNAAGELRCSVNGGAAVTLASRVRQFTVQYGVDTDSDAAIDRYVASAAMTPALRPSTRVQRLTLVFDNPMAGQAGQPERFERVLLVRQMNEP